MSNKPIGINPDKRLTVAAKKITGWEPEKVDNRELNQILFQGFADQVWGTSAQVAAGGATFYTDGAGLPLDASAASVTINEDDKILIIHDVTQTANLLLDCGGVKVTIEMYGGVTLDMDTYDLTLGGAGDSIGGDIRITQTGDLSIVGNRGLMINNSRTVYEDFKTKDLIIDVQTNTTVDVDASNIIFVDKFGGGKRADAVDLTLDSASDIVGGEAVKNSTWYGVAIDSDLTVKLTPDTAGTSGTASTGFLVFAAGTFATDLYKAGDVVQNTEQRTETTISVTPTIDGDPVALTDDIFATGDTFNVKMQSPDGLGNSWARVGTVFANSSGNFDNSYYTHVQETKSYTEARGDFTITSANWTTSESKLSISQDQSGVWFYNGYVIGTVSGGTTSKVLTISGINQRDDVAVHAANNSAGNSMWGFTSSSSTIDIVTTTGKVDWSLIFSNIPLKSKPSFHK